MQLAAALYAFAVCAACFLFAAAAPEHFIAASVPKLLPAAPAPPLRLKADIRTLCYTCTNVSVPRLTLPALGGAIDIAVVAQPPVRPLASTKPFLA